MGIRSLVHKRTALLLIASILLASFCLYPCSGSRFQDKKAGLHHGSSHHGSGSHDMLAMAADNSLHSDFAAAVLDKGPSSCGHCKVSAPALIEHSGNSRLIALGIPLREVLDYPNALTSDGSFANLAIPPPRYKNHIYILNSTYLI